MTQETPALADTLCPLCGATNECAIAAGRSAESCWCMTAEIPTDVLASIPEEAQGKVCICARCAGTMSEA